MREIRPEPRIHPTRGFVLTLAVLGGLVLSSAVGAQPWRCGDREIDSERSVRQRIVRLEKDVARALSEIERADETARAGGPERADDSRREAWMRGHPDRQQDRRERLDGYRTEIDCWQSHLSGPSSAGPSVGDDARSGPDGAAGSGTPATDEGDERPPQSSAPPPESGPRASADRPARPGDRQLAHCPGRRATVLVRYCRSDVASASPLPAPSASRRMCSDLGPVEEIHGLPVYPNAPYVVGVRTEEGGTVTWGPESYLEVVVTRDADERAHLYDLATSSEIAAAYGPGVRFEVDEDGVTTIRIAAEETGEAEGSELDVRLAGDGLPHVLFVSDEGELLVRVVSVYDACREQRPSPVRVRGILPENRFAIVLPDEPVLLEPGGEVELRVRPRPLLDRIHEEEVDRLFGARLRVEAWPIGDPDDEVLSVSSQVHRFLDAADDRHDDGRLELAKTLGDGPAGVAWRKREIELELGEGADVGVSSSRPDELAVERTAPGPNGSLTVDFDPWPTDRPETVEAVLELTAGDGRPIGGLGLAGVALPPQAVDFDEPGLVAALLEISRRASPGSVHPGLVTPGEAAHFSTPADARRMAGRVRDRADRILGSLGPGFAWECADPTGNCVEIDWIVRPHRIEGKLRMGFLGRTLPVVGTERRDGLAEVWAFLEGWTPETTSRAERDFRLAKLINPTLRSLVEIHPNNIIQTSRTGEPHELGPEQIANGLAKTLVHEIGHSLGLPHVAQARTRDEQKEDDPSTPRREDAMTEVQVMHLPESAAGTGTFRLAFLDAWTPPLPRDAPRQDVIDALDALRTVAPNDVFVAPCRFNGTWLAEPCGPENDPGAPHLVFELRNFLGKTDLPLMQGEWTDAAGTRPLVFTEIRPGWGAWEIEYRGRGILTGKTGIRGDLDLMFGSINDVDGTLEPRPGLSLDWFRVALGLSWEPEAMERIDFLLRAYTSALGRHPERLTW